MRRRLLPPAAVWMDERLVVSESPIDGRGLFFTDELAAGTVVIRFGGRLVSSAELAELIRDADVATCRHVAAGEEATLDYGTVSGIEGFWMACRCGAAVCRGEVTGADWRRVELQERYHGHWVPALQERIEAK